MYRQLCEFLRKECVMYGKLLELETAKTDVLVKGDVDGLDALMKSEQPIIMECANLEQRRQQLQESQGMGEATLKEIVLVCETQEKEELTQVMNDLSSVIEGLKKVNGTNMAIAATRMETIGYIASVLGTDDRQITYQRP